MNVQQLMTPTVKAVRENETAQEAARVMWDSDIGCVPVLDGDGRIVGMVTDRDLCMAAYTRGCALHEIVVSSVMSRELVTCSASDTLIAVEERMREHQIRRIPVVDGQRRILGMLSINDLTREAARERGGPRRHVGGEEVAATLAAIGEPRGARAITTSS